MKHLLGLTMAALVLAGCPAPWQKGSIAVISGYPIGATVADGVVTVTLPPGTASPDAETVVLEVRRSGEAIHRASQRWDPTHGLTMQLGSSERPVREGDVIKYGLSHEGVQAGFHGGFFLPKTPNTDPVDWVY